MRKLLILGFVIAAGLLGLSSCDTNGSNAGLLEGTWSLDSTETTSGTRELGDGNFTITYAGEVFFGVVFEMYSGTGTINGVDYIVGVAYIPSMQTTAISLSEPGEDSADHSINLEDNLYTGGKTMDGSYSGDGDYANGQTKDIGEGTFTATQS